MYDLLLVYAYYYYWCLYVIVYGYPKTDGSVFSNYLSFMLQQHPLLSICCAHRLHPFSRQKRLVVLFCVLAFAFFISVALLDNFYYDQVYYACFLKTITSDVYIS